FLQCPLTYDNSAMLLFVETLHTGLISNSGTDFAPALKMALEKHQVIDNQTVNNQQSKIVILISDGEDFGDETTQIAKEIKEQQIKLYTIGIGTKKGSKIPQGYKFKRDNKGDDVITTLNAKPLQELAELTGGKYFEINEKDNQISQLIDSIDLLEGELRSSKEIDSAANRYFYFLLAAFILMVLDMVIKVKVVKI
ncbi:MAG: VWA domain-containing protein, partial [Flammeovirgaceae bacterium]|nr:VWA domain-containing protein [Flammeovirgaceae bacterium]